MVYQQIYWQCEVCSKNAQMCKGLRGSEEFKLKIVVWVKAVYKSTNTVCDVWGDVAC